MKGSDDPTGSTQSKQRHLERRRLAQVMSTQIVFLRGVSGS